MNILDKIVVNKKMEVALAKSRTPVTKLEGSDFFNRDCYSFKDFLLDPQRDDLAVDQHTVAIEDD